MREFYILSVVVMSSSALVKLRLPSFMSIGEIIVSQFVQSTRCSLEYFAKTLVKFISDELYPAATVVITHKLSTTTRSLQVSLVVRTQ